MSTIVIAGGTGFIGRHLRERLERDAIHVVVLTRRPRPGHPNEIAWQPDGRAGAWASQLDGAEAVINLAGESIGTKRWSAARKRALRDSRINATRSLVAALRDCRMPPAVFLSASGMNYYAPAGDTPVTEESPPGDDVLAQLCVAWEQEALRIANGRTRVVITRSGLVMSFDGGALPEIARPFRFGVGGTLGSGRQFMPWIHIDDWVELALWLMRNDAARGAFNVTAPNPVTNQEFTETLARVLRRPAIFRVPGFALRLIVGEFAEYLLTGPRMLPARAESLGFRFKYGGLEAALRDLLRRRDQVRTQRQKRHRDTETTSLRERP